MSSRKTETIIAWYTAFTLLIYIPVETWASLPYGLLNPYYLIDVVAMALLLAGTAISLRLRPKCAPEVLCAAYAWTTANGWRATFDRVYRMEQGEALDHGLKELWFVGACTAVSLIVFVILLVMVVRKVGKRPVA